MKTHIRSVSVSYIRKLLLAVCAVVFIAMAASCGGEVSNTNTPDVTLTPDAKGPAEATQAYYMAWLDKEDVISMNVIFAAVDEAETRHVVEMYKGSRYAETQGWTDKYMDEHFIVVKARYEWELYPNEERRADGLIDEYVYLTRGMESGVWTVYSRGDSYNYNVDGGTLDDFDAIDPAKIVRADYLSWLRDASTINMRVFSAEVDERETERIINSYNGSGLAQSRGWTDEYLEENFTVVKVRYECELDHSKTSREDGLLESCVYLTRDIKSGIWSIADRTAPSKLYDYSDLHDYDPADPADIVRVRYLRWLKEDFVKSMKVISAEVDDKETGRVKEAYKGSKLAEKNGWTEEHIDANLTAVKVTYECVLDQTKTSMKDGVLEGYVYLMFRPQEGVWLVLDRAIKNEDGSNFFDATDPAEVVRTEYTLWLEEDYTSSMKVISVKADEAETERMIDRYKGSELAESRGCVDDYLDENFITVKIRYDCELDHNKTFMKDGLLEGYVYLTRDINSDFWTISDRTSPRDVTE